MHWYTCNADSQKGFLNLDSRSTYPSPF